MRKPRQRLFRIELWLTARLLPLLIAGRDLEGALRLADGTESRRYDGLAADAIAHAVLRVTRRPWLMRDRRCFRQGILGYRFLKMAGYSPQLHFAIDEKSLNEPVIDAHCWVVLDGKPVLNDIMDGMFPIHVHPA
ncbi:lasso peptide biosynthesis B2 protein [Hoeflea poritis]|uniref:Lasso peptide biosynthesis B2 protein n=1 Tax=Hoeflea poritis TaxID=2993659 RepID=A0ABT4VNB2_9HYPH|nr:lasso peptide biosynthesis B2 protein [Hoeflea poritis]MDA4846201.1 lasso peptide biosynthesis B2 protein [Hoeflea poritis]